MDFYHYVKVLYHYILYYITDYVTTTNKVNKIPTLHVSFVMGI